MVWDRNAWWQIVSLLMVIAILIAVIFKTGPFMMLVAVIGLFAVKAIKDYPKVSYALGPLKGGWLAIALFLVTLLLLIVPFVLKDLSN